MRLATVVFTLLVFGAAGASSFQSATGAARAKTLDICFVDVDGGQSTLVVTPAGQSLLIDAGFAGNGNRDPDRIMTAARAAGIEDTRQLHRTHHSDAQNFPDAFIANIEEGPTHTGAWIKVSAEERGSLTVTNGGPA